MSKIVAKDFALAVISGNPCPGDTAKEISENAIKLYLAALETVKEFNEKESTIPKATIRKKPDWL